MCSQGKAANRKLLANTCYGAVEGTGPMPADLAAQCNGCVFMDLYCADNQIAFPECPQGFKKTYNYIDRYGWGGIDLSKYTLCEKI